MLSTKVLIILRGLPGAGKSSLAKLLNENGNYPVFEIDDYFTAENGDYHFQFENNHKAYKLCETNTEEAMRNELSKIFVANTFTLDWEIAPYFKLAQKYNYQVYVVTVENYHGANNIHEIEKEQLQKMADKYKVKLLP